MDALGEAAVALLIREVAGVLISLIIPSFLERVTIR